MDPVATKRLNILALTQELLAQPAFTFDIDGTLIPHELSRSEIYQPIMQLVVEAASLLSPVIPIIATNKTATEVSAVHLSVPVITATENCCVISIANNNSQLATMLEAILPVDVIKVLDQKSDTVKYLLGVTLDDLVTKTRDFLSDSSHFQKILNQAIGSEQFSSNWELRAISEAAKDSDLLRNVITYLGFKNEAEALRSCNREGNSPVFIRDKVSGKLVPFMPSGLDLISKQDWDQLNQEAAKLDIFLSRSSKAISVCPLACQEGKGLAIRLARSLLSQAGEASSKLIFAGDAKNDVPAVTELSESDTFIQLPNTQGKYDGELARVAEGQNCRRYQSVSAAPLALAEIICETIDSLGAQASKRLTQISSELKPLMTSYQLTE